MLWARLLAYVTGTVNQELLLRNEYLAAENRILRGQIQGRLLLSEGEKATLAEIAHRLGRMALEDVAATAKPAEVLREGSGIKVSGTAGDGHTVSTYIKDAGNLPWQKTSRA